MDGRLAFAVAHVLTLACFLYSRYFLRFPLFVMWLAVSTALAVGYRPESPVWLRWYVQIQPAATLLLVFCALESAFHQGGRVGRRGRLIAGLALISVPYVALIWSIHPGDSLALLVQLRRYAQIGVGAFMLAGVGFYVSQGLWRRELVFEHSALLALYSIKQAVFSALAMRQERFSAGVWYQLDPLGLWISAGLLLAWGVLAVIRRRRVPMTWPEPRRLDRTATV